MGARRLWELNVKGVMVEFPTEDEPVKVFLRKLNRVEHEEAAREAGKVRSQVMAAAKDRVDFNVGTREEMIDFLVKDAEISKRQLVEAEVAAEEGSEWAENDYLQGLIDSWEGGLKEKHAVDPEDEKAKKVFEEMERYNAEVEERLGVILRDIEDEANGQTDEQLTERVKERMLLLEALTAWITEYKNQEIFIATREEDKVTPYFENRRQLDLVDDDIFARLMEEYRAISVDPMEGKD